MDEASTLDLEAQIQELRKEIASLKDFRARARLTVDGKPNFDYLNERFRNYEIIISNQRAIISDMADKHLAALEVPVLSNPEYVKLTSQPCRQKDMETSWFYFWCGEMDIAARYHRKIWEHCYIAQALFNSGKLSPGSKGIGFGCGRELNPSLFAKYGAVVLATDYVENDRAHIWNLTGQVSSDLNSILYPSICPDTELLKNISFRSVDMNNIPRDLDEQFDFCWSSCALEHLGSIQRGLDFIEKSLKTLRSGGVAVHTLEFNIQDEDTIDNWTTVLYQKSHIRNFVDYLTSAGFSVSPLDFDIGDMIFDNFIDIPEVSLPGFSVPRSCHIKLSVDGFPCTSLGLIIRKP